MTCATLPRIHGQSRGAVGGLVVLGLLVLGGWWWFSPRPETTINTPTPVLPSATRAEDREPQSLCPQSGTHAVEYDQLQVVITRQEAFLCGAVVRTRAGATLAESELAAAVTGEYVDLDADGAPELLVVADSGGSGGFTDWFVFTQRPQPKLVGMMTDACTIAAGPQIPGHRRVLASCSLSWSFWDGLCNACSPRPLMFYQMQDGELVDANLLMVPEYDRYIANVRKSLDDMELEQFTAATTDEDAGYKQDYVRGGVLAMVLAYKNSGRGDLARDTVTRWWPAFDRERILEEVVGE